MIHTKCTDTRQCETNNTECTQQVAEELHTAAYIKTITLPIVNDHGSQQNERIGTFSTVECDYWPNRECGQTWNA